MGEGTDPLPSIPQNPVYLLYFPAMTSNEIFQNSRVAHVRELKAEVARLREELAQTRAELEGLRSHFALALEAARDADRIPAGGRLVIVDGWNALLGSASVLPPAERRLPIPEKEERLRALVRTRLDAHPLDFAWIVFDGARPGGTSEDRLRITFTGGEGPHRADRLVCDYLRMRRLSGSAQTVLVVTDDRDFRHEAESLGATVAGVDTLTEST